MKKISIYLSHIDYKRSWVDTNIISELSKFAHITIIASSETIQACRIDLFEIPNISYSDIKVGKIRFIPRAYFLVSMIIKRNINKSFRTRLRNLIFGEVRLFPRSSNPKIILFALFYNIKCLNKYVFNYWYQIPAFIPIINRLFYHLLKNAYEKQNYKLPLALRHNFDLVIFVSGGIEVEIFEMIKELRRSKIPTLICIENWDNLTSKRFMISKPDYVFVMGEESKKQAARIQGIDKASLIAAGLPRFNPYRRVSIKKINAQNNKFTILYVGCYLPHNEIYLLNSLITKLDNSIISGKYRIIYKPHPGPRNRYFDAKKLNSFCEKVFTDSRSNPLISNSHMNQIQSADLIISTPSSIIIEAMILKKRILLDLTKDGIHRTTTGSAFNDYVHFKNLEKIENLKKCFSIEQVFSAVLFEYENKSNLYIDYKLDDLIENQSKSYSHHILKLVGINLVNHPTA